MTGWQAAQAVLNACVCLCAQQLSCRESAELRDGSGRGLSCCTGSQHRMSAFAPHAGFMNLQIASVMLVFLCNTAADVTRGSAELCSRDKTAAAITVLSAPLIAPAQTKGFTLRCALLDLLVVTACLRSDGGAATALLLVCVCMT